MVTTHLNNIARLLGTTPEEASRALNSLVQRIWAEVATRGSATITGMGTFRRSGQTFIFEPEESLAVAVNEEYLGLEAYDLPAPGKNQTEAEEAEDKTIPYVPSEDAFMPVGPRFAPIDTTVEPLDQPDVQPFPFTQKEEEDEWETTALETPEQPILTAEAPEVPAESADSWELAAESRDVSAWNPGPEEEEPLPVPVWKPDTDEDDIASIWSTGPAIEPDEDLTDPELKPFAFGEFDDSDEQAVRNPWAPLEKESVDDVWKWESEDNPEEESGDEVAKGNWNFNELEETTAAPEWPPFEGPDELAPEEPVQEHVAGDWEQDITTDEWTEQIPPEDQVEEPQPEVVYEPYVEEIEESEEEVEEEQVTEERENHAAFAAAVPPPARRRSPMLWLVPIVFFALAGGLFFYLRSLEGNQRLQLDDPGARPSAAITDSSMAVPSGTDSMAIASPETDTALEPDGTESEPALTQAAADPVRGREPIDVAAGGWTWIVASDVNREAAEARAEELRQQGLRSSVLYGEYKGVARYRVAVGQFRNDAEARRARQIVAATSKDAWLLPVQQTFKVF